jgi:hypothetical protein
MPGCKFILCSCEHGSLTFLFLPKISSVSLSFLLIDFRLGKKPCSSACQPMEYRQALLGPFPRPWLTPSHPFLSLSSCATLSTTHLVPSVSYCHPGIVSSSPSLILLFLHTGGHLSRLICWLSCFFRLPSYYSFILPTSYQIMSWTTSTRVVDEI